MVNKNSTFVKIKFLAGYFLFFLYSFVAHMGLDQLSPTAGPPPSRSLPQSFPLARWSTRSKRVATAGLDEEPTAPKNKCHDMFLS